MIDRVLFLQALPPEKRRRFRQLVAEAQREARLEAAAALTRGFMSTPPTDAELAARTQALAVHRDFALEEGLVDAWLLDGLDRVERYRMALLQIARAKADVDGAGAANVARSALDGDTSHTLADYADPKASSRSAPIVALGSLSAPRAVLPDWQIETTTDMAVDVALDDLPDGMQRSSPGQVPLRGATVREARILDAMVSVICDRCTAAKSPTVLVHEVCWARRRTMRGDEIELLLRCHGAREDKVLSEETVERMLRATPYGSVSFHAFTPEKTP